MCGIGKPTAELAALSALETCQPDLVRTWAVDKLPSAHRSPITDHRSLVNGQWSMVTIRINRQRCPDRLAFKKTCPFDSAHRVCPKGSIKARPLLLPSFGEWCDEIKKGNTGFQAKRLEHKPSWANKPRSLFTQSWIVLKHRLVSGVKRAQGHRHHQGHAHHVQGTDKRRRQSKQGKQHHKNRRNPNA